MAVALQAVDVLCRFMEANGRTYKTLYEPEGHTAEFGRKTVTHPSTTDYVDQK